MAEQRQQTSKRFQDQAIYTKVYELARWLFPHVGRYPKSERAILGGQTKQTLLDMLRCLIMAYQAQRKLSYLSEASAHLDALRMLMRLVKDERIA